MVGMGRADGRPVPRSLSGPCGCSGLSGELAPLGLGLLCLREGTPRPATGTRPCSRRPCPASRPVFLPPQPWSAPQEDVPPRLCTSPIPWGGLAGFPSDSPLGTTSEPDASIAGMAPTGRKKKRRRRKAKRKEDTVAANSSSEELEAGTESEPSPLEKPRPEPLGYVGGRGCGHAAGGSRCFLCRRCVTLGRVLDLSGLQLLYFLSDVQARMPCPGYLSCQGPFISLWPPQQHPAGGGVLTRAQRHLPLL